MNELKKSYSSEEFGILREAAEFSCGELKSFIEELALPFGNCQVIFVESFKVKWIAELE
jgi:hypothetical protein